MPLPRLPLAILLPTRNAMKLLPGHLRALGDTLDLATEIIVVDSESTDGSVEFLRKNLPPDRARFFTRPRGLYQSWNFGIAQATAPYLYVSTVGDPIDREGLSHLQEIALRHDADVVISPPEFISAGGEPIGGNDWPIHHIVSAMQLKSDITFEGLVPFVLALSFLPFALLGSSAGNLYRTSILQQHPFPTDFGTNGDGAWGLLHGIGLKLAITPRRVSGYRKHRKSYSRSEYRAPDGDARMLDAGLKLLDAALAENPPLRTQAATLKLDDFVAAKKTVQYWRTKLQNGRHRFIPWIFNPIAIYARVRRQAAHRNCVALVESLLTNSGAYSYPAPSSAVASRSA